MPYCGCILIPLQAVDRLVGRLVGWLVGWSVGRSVGRWVGQSVGQSVGRSDSLSVGRWLVHNKGSRTLGGFPPKQRINGSADQSAIKGGQVLPHFQQIVKGTTMLPCPIAAVF